MGRNRGSRSSSSKPAGCWRIGDRRSATRIWPGAPMGNSWPSAATVTTAASTSGTSAAGAVLGASRAHQPDHGRPVRSLGLPAGDQKLGWDDPAVGRGLGGASGDGAGRDHGFLAGRPPTGCRDSREGRRLGGGRGRGMSDAPPGDARQPHREAGRHRSDGGGCEPRRPAGGDLRWGWRPTLGDRDGSRIGPSQGRFTARPCCFTPTGRA